MVENIENQILEFVKNRYQKGESTASRHVHIRFGIEIFMAEEILDLFSHNDLSKFYDEDYQENRYKPK